MPDASDKLTTQELAAQTLQVPAEDLFFGRIESEFPWVKQGGILWARTSDFRSALFWVRPDGPDIWLNPPELKGLPGLSFMLSSNVDDLPDKLKPIELAEAVRKLAVEPRGYVASQEFLKKHKPYLVNWLPQNNAQQQKLFADQCQDPILTKGESEKWKLSFKYFNPQGGVEQWIVEGDARHISSAKESEALPDKTFYWPFA